MAKAVCLAEQVPYREPGTRPAGRLSARAGVLLGLIILACGAGLIVVGWFWIGSFMTYPLVIGLSLVLLINFGPITWTITALVGCAVLGMTLGRARRAARQGSEVLPDPPTDPMAVSGAGSEQP